MEGKELLLSCIFNIKKSCVNYNKKELIVDRINLFDLFTRLVDNIDNFAYVSNDVIEYILNAQKTNNVYYKKELLQARDLLLGKREYNLRVTLSDNHQAKIEKFINELCTFLESNYPGIIDSENIRYKISALEDAINLNRLIVDFEFVEDIVKEYDLVNFDNNMLSIMSYINIHNLDVMKIKRKNAPTFDIQLIKKPKLDSQIEEILEKIGVSIEELPNYLLSELKKADAKKMYNTYSLIKKNKAEDGGIIHLISKNNILSKLIILLYSSDETVLEIINAIKPKDGTLNIGMLKVLLNQTPVIFLSKNNDYFKPKFENFIKNINFLKENSINYPALISRCPLFFLMDNNMIEYTLSYLKKEGANTKKVINKCYKVLANDPSLLIENVNIMKKYSIKLSSFFSLENENYSLLKVKKLNSLLNSIIKTNGENVVDNLEVMNRLLVQKAKKGDLS